MGGQRRQKSVRELRVRRPKAALRGPCYLKELKGRGAPLSKKSGKERKQDPREGEAVVAPRLYPVFAGLFSLGSHLFSFVLPVG